MNPPRGIIRIDPLEVLVKSRISRTVGAAVGAVFFMLFCADIAARLANPVSAAETSTYSVIVTP